MSEPAIWIVLFSRDGESADFRRDFVAGSDREAWRRAASWFRSRYPGEDIAIAVDQPNRYPDERTRVMLDARTIDG